MLIIRTEIIKTIIDPIKRTSNPSKKIKKKASKTESVTEIQVSDSDTSTDIEDNDSIVQRILPEIALSFVV